MQIPTSFARALEHEFDGRLRIRWSQRFGEWHVEQKVDREILPPRHIADWDDDAVRARDGYAYVMAVRTGDRMPCKKCGAEVRVPVFRTGDTKCPNCKANQYACYFPLNDMLLEHLRRIDPFRDGIARSVAEVDLAMRRKELREEAAMADASVAMAEDLYHHITDNPTIRLSGGTKMWI